MNLENPLSQDIVMVFSFNCCKKIIGPFMKDGSVNISISNGSQMEFPEPEARMPVVWGEIQGSFLL